MKIDLTNKVVVITGSSRGLGRELAIAFAKENAKTVINYFNSESEAKKLYNEITKYNKNCILIKADVRKEEEVNYLCTKTLSHFGKIDVLVNNAGICDDGLLETLTVVQWKDVIETNITGAFLCSQAFGKVMIKQKEGNIINIASLKGQTGSVRQTNYSASKAGLIGMTKSLAQELAKYNIKVNAICPGYVQTDLNRDVNYKKENANKESLLNSKFSLEDLVNFVLFLSSEKIKGVSGQVFNIDSRLKLDGKD